MTRRVRLETNLGDIRRHTAQVFEEFASLFDIHFAWGIGATGDHKAGKALDLMAYARGSGPDNPGQIRPGWNRDVAHYAWAHRKRLGIDYVIYDQLIQSNNPDGYAYGGWHDYPGKSHANHVHISFEENPPAYRPPATLQPEEPEMQLNDTVKLGKWVKDRWSGDKGLQDGISVSTALASGYGHSRAANENTTKILKTLRAQNATIDALSKALADHARLDDPEAFVETIRAAVADATIDVDVTVRDDIAG